MPKSNRQYMLRYADQTLLHLEHCLALLGVLRNIYAGAPPPMAQAEDTMPEMIEPVPGLDHPDYRQAVEGIGLILAQAHEMLTVFRKQVM